MNSKGLLGLPIETRLLIASNGFSQNVKKMSCSVSWAKGFFWGLMISFAFWFIFICDKPW
jgi:hypothetical protein